MKLAKTIGRKLLTGYGIIVTLLAVVIVMVLIMTNVAKMSVWDLLAAVSSNWGSSSTTLFFTPYGNETLTPGDTTSIDVNINTKVPINAVGVTISYSSSTLEIVGISKQKSVLNLWTEDTSILEGSGLIHFSGGTTVEGGIMGNGTLLTITVRAKSPGKTRLDFNNVQVYPSDGTGVAVSTTLHSITYNIPSPATAPPGVISPGGGASISAASQPSADLNGDGKVDLVDLSILTVKMILGYDPRYDLNSDGALNLGDIATLISKMGPVH